MRLSEAIEHLNMELPKIKEFMLSDIANNAAKEDLLRRFQLLEESLKSKDPKYICRKIRVLAFWYMDKINDANIRKMLSICEMIGLFISSGKKPVVFISHSSKDLKYVNPLSNFVSGLGVSDNQKICTSDVKHKIPIGQNIYSYLAEAIHENCLMINLLSENYLGSLACMCETGAAWVSGCPYIMLYTSKQILDDPRLNEMPLDIKTMGIILDNNQICRRGMIELGETIKQFLKISDNQNIESPVNRFMEEITLAGCKKNKII
jgi:hypothetical protein